MNDTILPDNKIKVNDDDWQYFTEFGGEEYPTNCILQSQKEFDSVFSQIHNYLNPKPKIPQFDFKKKSIGVLHFGTIKTGGTSFIYNGFHENEIGGITVHITNNSSSSMDRTMVITNPVLLFILPKTQKKINTIVTSNL